MNYEYVYKLIYIHFDIIMQLQSLSGWMRALLSTRHMRGRDHQNSRLHFEIGTEVP